jgi:hypothetical protein
MKIAIIGAGWVGCHLAKALTLICEVDLFDEIGIFSGTSSRNQNRLHLGFHYPRNYRTRNLCQSTFNRFIEEYKSLVKPVESNVYAVPVDYSTIDFHTYTSIFEHEGIPYLDVKCRNLIGIEGSILTGEYAIDHFLAKEYFTKLHKNIFEVRRVLEDSIPALLTEYDFVINCTNNAIKDKSVQAYHELSLSLLYRKVRSTEFDALTVVDGNFFSIFPYSYDLFTVTSVQNTPIYSSYSLQDITSQQSQLTDLEVDSIRERIVKCIISNYPSFVTDFEYAGYFTSIKSKTVNSTADRYPIITTDSRLINCFTGKIQGIFVIEDFIKKYITNYECFDR